MQNWTENSATQAQVKVLILDNFWPMLPRPPFTDSDAEAAAQRVYDYVWERSKRGDSLAAA